MYCTVYSTVYRVKCVRCKACTVYTIYTTQCTSVEFTTLIYIFFNKAVSGSRHINRLVFKAKLLYVSSPLYSLPPLALYPPSPHPNLIPSHICHYLSLYSTFKQILQITTYLAPPPPISSSHSPSP